MALNSNTINDIARIGIALSFADGDIDEKEVAMLMLALGDLGVSDDAAQAAIEAATSEVEKSKSVDALIASSCAAIPSKARPTVFEACAHVLMGDGVFGEAEVQRLAAVKGLLAIDDAVAFRVIASAAVSCAEDNEGLTVGE